MLLVALVASCGLWMQVASQTGDLWSRWTDHLRHEGEAVALLSRGPGIYTQTYAQATADVPLPCPQHAGLWADSGIPYPPLGVLLHAPSALAERAGWLSPVRSHALLCWVFGVAGLLATWLGAAPLRAWRRWLFVITFGPLLVGSGLSGFYDPVYVVFALLAARSSSSAVLSFLIHFRGLIALSLIDLRKLGVFGGLLVAANLALAVVTSLHLGVFETHSAIHYSKPLGVVVAIAGAVLALRTASPAVMPVWMTSILLMLIDRQPSFWHLLVLAPLAVRVLDKGTNRAVLFVFAWIFVVSQLFLRTPVPFPVYWLTMR